MDQVEVTQQLSINTERLAKRDSLLKGLSVESYSDEEGNQRKVFTFSNKLGTPVRVMFYSTNELPYSSLAVGEGQAFIYGDAPLARSTQEWKAFVEKVGSHNVSKGDTLNPMLIDWAKIPKESIFFVETNPQNLLDLAILLSYDQTLGDERKAILQKRLTPRCEAVIDMLMAGRYLDSSDSLDYSEEALMMLALQGDEAARNYLEDVLNEVKQQDQLNKEKEKDELVEWVAENLPREEALKLEDLVAVHITDYLPRDNKGRLEMKSTFEATEWKAPRDTVHFSLNHPVASHMYGSWESKPYAVIASLKRMMELNGNPTVLNTVDTFFEVSPGHRLTLPEDAYIVKPGILEEGKLFEKVEGKQEVRYKASKLSPKDVVVYLSELSKTQSSYLNDQVCGVITASHDPSVYGGSYNFEFDNEGALITRADYEKLNQILGSVLERRDVLTLLKEKSIQETVLQLYKEAGIEEKIPLGIVKSLVRQIEGIFVSGIKNKAIYKQIEDLGYESHAGGMWAWDRDSFEATRKTTKLGAELGIPVLPHSGHISHDVEGMFAGSLERGAGLINLLHSGDIPGDVYRDRAYTYVKEKFAELSPQMRRMLYLIGAF